MDKRRILVLVPISLILCFIAYTWYQIITKEYLATWRHYVGLIGFFILVFLFFKNQVAVILATGIYLILGVINILAITAVITTSGISIMSVSTPGIQLLSLGIFILYFILNFSKLVVIYLDYKDAKAVKRKF